MKVRVRYAPSPTGLQHIGGVRTALYNYFFAKASGGEFFLRLEDTDQSRFDPRAINDLYDTFAWLGITPDEGPREGGPFAPYVQSERRARYAQIAELLINKGAAYYCFCSSQDLESMRGEQQKAGLATGYDRRCRHVSEHELQENLKAGKKPVVRFKLDTDGETVVHDVLLGAVAWPNKDIPADPVLLKADGFPTYHLAHVVDDHDMQTSHVLRGQEWLPSAPLHVQLFAALEWQAPVYCHLSMIMGTDGHKLSKRHGSTSAQDFRLGGYVREAIINYVTLLGWSFDGERQMFSRQDLESLFSIEKLSRSPAVFDYQKLDWFNGQYIRSLDLDDLWHRVLPYLLDAGIFKNAGHADEEENRLGRAALEYARERMVKLSDAVTVLRFLFVDPPCTDASMYIPKKQTAKDVSMVLERLLPTLDVFATRGDAENEVYYHGLADEWNMKLGNILMPLRLAITGSSASPPLMPCMRLLGVDRCRQRLVGVIRLLQSGLVQD